MKKYTKEKFKEDCEWLRGQGVKSEEVEYFVKYLLGQGFMMTRPEFVTLIKSVEK